jgi:hypothetical protein
MHALPITGNGISFIPLLTRLLNRNRIMVSGGSMSRFKVGFSLAISLALFSSTRAYSQEGRNCLNEKKLKVLAEDKATGQWIKFEDYRIDIGGKEEVYLGDIDKEMVRRSMIECMHGTVRCLRQNPQEASQGKIILSFDLANENQLFPKISHLKVDFVDFKGEGLRSCLTNFWSDVRYPKHSEKTQSASIRIPLNIGKTGASR